MAELEYDVIDRVIRETLEVMESSKYQIFEICENARIERDALQKELQELVELTKKTIDEVDRLEYDYKRARVRLTEVSRDFQRFREEDIKVAYEAATSIQMQLAIFREKENHLRVRREELGQRLKRVNKSLERAETIVHQMNVAFEYLSGDMTKVTRILESAKNRQMLGLKIILAQEDERKRIAREIHDGLAQSLANVVLRSEIAERMLVKQEYPSVKEELRELKSQVRDGLEEVRKIIFNLRPMALDDLGVVPTVRKFVQDFEEKTRIRTKFELIGKEGRLPSGMEAAIFRMVQEAFSNVLKHAQASYVSVEFSFLKDAVRIVIQDNGKGFNVDQMEAKISKGNHFGLMGMRERLELVEGRVEIQSSKEAGTRLTIQIPNSPETKEETYNG